MNRIDETDLTTATFGIVFYVDIGLPFGRVNICSDLLHVWSNQVQVCLRFMSLHVTMVTILIRLKYNIASKWY